MKFSRTRKSNFEVLSILTDFSKKNNVELKQVDKMFFTDLVEMFENEAVYDLEEENYVLYTSVKKFNDDLEKTREKKYGSTAHIHKALERFEKCGVLKYERGKYEKSKIVLDYKLFFL